MNISVDGFIAAPDGSLNWHFDKWTNEMEETLCEQLSKADTILLGANTYTAMAAYWPARLLDYSYPRESLAVADMMNTYRKVVVSTTLTRLRWQNTRIVKSNIPQEVLKLKQQPGKDLIIFGSGMLVSYLARFSLIDEYLLWVHPIFLGNGRPLFTGLPQALNMRLERVTNFRSGVAVLRYAVV